MHDRAAYQGSEPVVNQEKSNGKLPRSWPDGTFQSFTFQWPVTFLNTILSIQQLVSYFPNEHNEDR